MLWIIFVPQIRWYSIEVNRASSDAIDNVDADADADADADTPRSCYDCFLSRQLLCDMTFGYLQLKGQEIGVGTQLPNDPHVIVATYRRQMHYGDAQHMHRHRRIMIHDD